MLLPNCQVWVRKKITEGGKNKNTAAEVRSSVLRTGFGTWARVSRRTCMLTVQFPARASNPTGNVSFLATGGFTRVLLSHCVRL